MRVLVLDDDAAIGRLVVRVATMQGLDAASVIDAVAFEQHLQNGPPDIILLDLQLGATDGVEQLRLLAARQYAGFVVLMSGFDARVLATVSQVGQGLGLKIEAKLEKPIQVAQLEQVLARLKLMDTAPSANRLMQAIRDDELYLDFQPVVTRQPRALKKLEALLRWDHPTRGRIPPDDFLPVAEANITVIDAITEWVIGAAIESYLIFAELGLDVPIAINISTQNLHDLMLPDRLEERLRSAGMPTRSLCLEITETAAFRDPTRTMDILSRARLKGMQLAIDDFGTGFSSFKILRQMPFSEIKIDRSFVNDLVTSRDSRAIVKSTIDLAANMEMTSVAEGVETEATATLLESMNVGALQGYHIARPMPVEAIAAWFCIWMREGGPGEPRHRSLDAAQEQSRLETETVRGGETSPQFVVGVRDEPTPASDVIPLSEGQREVMQLLSQGCSVKAIACRLDLTMRAVRVYLSQAYMALGARNRIEAVTRAKMFAHLPGVLNPSDAP